MFFQKKQIWVWMRTDAVRCGMEIKLPCLKFGFLFCEYRVVLLIYFSELLWGLEFIYVKCFACSRCSIIVACISVITITWDLVPPYECLFSTPPKTWEGTIENQIFMWGKCRSRISIFCFWFVKMSWIHLPFHSPKWLFHTLALHKTHFLLSHSQVSLLYDCIETIQKIRNKFSQTLLTTSIYPLMPASVPRCLPFCRWTVSREDYSLYLTTRSRSH